MDLLLILLAVLIVIVLVGHGIWAAIAWLLRGGRSRSSAKYEPTLSDDRAATARFLQHLRARGAIDDETHARMMRAIAQDTHPVARSVATYLTRKREREEPDEVEAILSDFSPAQEEAPPAESSTPSRQPTTGKSQFEPVEERAASPPMFRDQHDASQPGPQPKERRPLSEILASFMAERNIRWGELIGGLLILCSSAALVISLWSRIEAIPVLKFVIFTAMTAALFGAGLFVYHRWKIPTTGHVVLLIATLLVPLNLLAFAAFSLHGPVTGGWTLPIELAAVALFAWLAFLAARVVMPVSPLLFAGGLLGISACSLVVRLATPPLSGAVLWGLALLPVLLYLAVMAASLRGVVRLRRIGDEGAKHLLMQLGIQSFACVVPFGLIAYESRLAAGALRFLSPVVCVIAVPALCVGLFVWRRLERDAPSQLRTVAGSVGLIGLAVMLISVGLAWPQPSRLIPVIGVIGLAMLALTRVARHPTVHGCMVAAFAAAWVITVHVFRGLSWSEPAPRELLANLLSAQTGQALVAAVAACGLVGAWFGRRRRHVLSRTYALAAFAIASISVALVTVFGFGRSGDPAHVTWVYVVYAVAAFVIASRKAWPLAVWGGGVLAQMAICQALIYLWPIGVFTWPVALLVGASACATAVVTLRYTTLGDRHARAFIGPLARMGVATSLLAAIWLGWRLHGETAGGFAICMAWLSVLWLVLAFTMCWPLLLAGTQLAMALAAGAGVHLLLQGRSWYGAGQSPLTEPWVLQSYALAVALVCLVWAITRAAVAWRVRFESVRGSDQPKEANETGKWPFVAQNLLNPGVPLADRWLTVLVVGALVILSVWSVVPGIMAEHGWLSLAAGASSHTHAAGAGSWLLFAVLAATLSAGLTGGSLVVSGAGALIAIACGVALVAARFESTNQIVTALRWLNGALFLASLAAFWTREYWAGRVFRGVQLSIRRGPVVAGAVALPCLLFALPAVVLALTFAQAVSSGTALLPSDISGLGLRWLLIGPLVPLAMGLIGYGRRLQQPAFAVATAAVSSIIVTFAELGALHRANLNVSYIYLFWLVQLNVIVTASIAMVWRLSFGWDTRLDSTTLYPRWPLQAGRAAMGMVLLIAAIDLWIRPSVSAGVAAAGTGWGWLAVLLVECSMLIAATRREDREFERAASVWVMFGVVLLAFSLSRFDTGNWLCFHALMVGLVAAGWLQIHFGARHVRGLLGSGWEETFETVAASARGPIETITHDVTCRTCGYNLRGLSPMGRCPECSATIRSSLDAVMDRLSPQWAGRLLNARLGASTSALFCAALATLFAIRAAFDDPQRPWWSVAVLAATGALCMALAGWVPRRTWAYAGGLEVCLAASVWWLIWRSTGTFSRAVTEISNLAQVNIIALAVGGATWLAIERKRLNSVSAADHIGRWPAYHRAAAGVSVVGVFLLAIVSLWGAATRQQPDGLILLQWLSWGAAAALLIACRVDWNFREVGAGIYVLGLTAVVLLLAHAGLATPTLWWALSLGLAGYTLLATLASTRWAARLGRWRQDETGGDWLLVANGLLAIISVLLGLYVSFTNAASTPRMLVALAPALWAVSAVIASTSARRELLRTIAAGLFSASAIMFSWSWAPPGSKAFVLQRGIGVIAAFAAIVIASSAVRYMDHARRWTTAVGRNLANSGLLAGAALLVCIFIELRALIVGSAIPVTSGVIAAMIASLGVIIASCVAFAVNDRLDPIGLRPGVKEVYVYVAEWLAAVLALHVRATMPWLFSGVITQYWPMLVMGLAFAAIAAGEICERRGVHVLARPLSRTGMFLPALGVLDLFIAASQVHFSIVLLTMGALYAVLAGMRRSVGLGMVAALALNGSLWYLLSRTPSLGLTKHPQLWFIPPALAVLAAGHLNRDRLDARQRVTLHYVCLLVVYLSSTADIFLIGVARAPWLPLVLAGLSLVGMLVGFISRIRSFLMLGTGFLCLSLLTMIWHATVNLGWTWLWYVAGIALGIGIISVFALFEKKRNEMNTWLHEIRTWSD